MIFLGLLVGVYSYLLFLLGILGLFSSDIIRYVSLLFLIIFAIFFAPVFVRDMRTFFSQGIKNHAGEHGLVLLLVIMSVVNLVGALGPELAFDALWYHLTLPKLYLLKESIVFIPGGLLYYSAMPKLVEMLYVGGLAFGGEIYPKVTHFLFGLFTLVLVYRTSRLFVSKAIALLACVIFYANLVVAWESVTAYVDLVWAFYSFGSIYLFLLFTTEKKKIFLYLSSAFVGLAISVKLVAVGSLLLLLLALLFLKFRMKDSYLLSKKDFFFVLLFSLVVPLPWFLFSLIHTGNPVYPFFSSLYSVSFPVFSVRNIFDTLSVFFVSSDPISPIYIICVPLVILFYKYFSRKEKMLLFLAGIALLVWFLTPKSGGGRFILTFLPLFSVLVVITAEKIKKNKLFYKLILFAIVITMMISIGYRGLANSKYIPAISGKQPKGQFLGKNLNFSYGDFYDVDDFLAKKLSKSDVVLLIGFHNLSYVDFAYIDQSWVKKGDRFHYVAVQNDTLPKRFSVMKKIYENKQTGVSVYGSEGKTWIY